MLEPGSNIVTLIDEWSLVAKGQLTNTSLTTNESLQKNTSSKLLPRVGLDTYWVNPLFTTHSRKALPVISLVQERLSQSMFGQLRSPIIQVQ